MKLRVFIIAFICLSIPLLGHTEKVSNPYLYEQLERNTYKKTFNALFEGQRNLEPWLKQYLKNRDGVDTPSETRVIGNKQYEFYKICQPHYCPGNVLCILFEQGGTHAWAFFTKDDGSSRFFGNPNAEIQATLKANIGDGNETSTANNTQAFADAGKHVELSEVTDPSGLAHLFFGQVVAIGYGADLAVDNNLKLLLTGALADEIEGDVTPETVLGAFNKATLLSIENGDAVWEGRRLPAALVTVDISTVDRAAGKYNHICMKLGGIRDYEFNYIRSPKYIFCDKDKPTLDKDLKDWKKQTNFKLISSY